MSDNLQSGLIGQREMRLAKLKKMIELGIDPFPAKTNKEKGVGEVLASFEDYTDKQVITAGRLISWRRHGQIAFGHLRDSTGEMQIFLQSAMLGEADVKKGELNYEQIKELVDLGDFLEVKGKTVLTSTGEKSIAVESLRIITKALRPLPKSYEEVTDTELLYRKRYIETNIDREKYQRFVRRAKFWEAHRDFFRQNGFLEMNIPVLEHVTGGADATPFVTHMNALDETFYLRISQELYLKRLIGGGYDKVYEIGPRFRNEGMSDEHLPEHIAMEFYWAYADWKDGMKFIQEMFRYVYNKVYGKLKFSIKGFEVDLAKDWEVVDYTTIIKDRFGVDVFNTSMEEIKKVAKAKGVVIEEGVNLNRAIDSLWKSLRKDVAGPIFLVGEPKFMSPLAKSDPNNPLITQRFHPIIAGSELGNAFSELNDPLDQLERFMEQQDMRDSGDSEAQMLDVDFVEMLEYGMPPTFGYGHSERNFWFFEDAPAKDCVPFPPMRQTVSQINKKIYQEVYGKRKTKEKKG